MNRRAARWAAAHQAAPSKVASRTNERPKRSIVETLWPPRLSQMRSAGPGTAEGEARIVVAAILTVVLAVLGRDRRRAVEIAELDVEIGCRRLKVLGTEIGRRARDIARVGLLDGELGDRLALDLVGLQQLRASHALEHQRQLPREIVGIVNARVAAEAAIGGHQVSGVAGQEDAPVAKPARHVGGGTPARDAIDLHGQVGNAGAGANQLDQPLLADVGGGIGGGARIDLGIADRIHHQEAVVQPSPSGRSRRAWDC